MAALLACCGSRRWARRVAAHRPYPDLDALLAAADEACYDLRPAELARGAGRASPPAAQTLVGARGRHARRAHRPARRARRVREPRSVTSSSSAWTATAPEELLDQVLAGIRTRLGNEPEEERSVAAEELRRLARGRLARLV